jgi:ABC-type nitrate/sulfonate/bicarbonate transport system ATPase subunit
VRRNICLPIESVGINKKERTARIDKTLDLVGLREFETKYPSEEYMISEDKVTSKYWEQAIK